MIGYLKGEVKDRSTDGKVLLALVVSGGGTIGYSVNVPVTATYDELRVGSVAELFVYTHVREDQLELFGFTSRLEKDLFLTLLDVNGIGPKAALSLLSNCDPARLVQAILEGDKDTLTKVPGVGKKTAERLVLELADSVRKKTEAGVFPIPRMGGVGRGAGATADRGAVKAAQTSVYRDAKEALIGLGYREQDAVLLLDKTLESLTVPPLRAEELIRSALRGLS